MQGMHDALALLEGRDLDVEALAEGTIFRAGDPVLQITGDYLDFCVLETAILGYLCQQSGVATKAARCKTSRRGSAGDQLRREANAPRARAGDRTIGLHRRLRRRLDGPRGGSAGASQPSGTMPHALISDARQRRGSHPQRSTRSSTPMSPVSPLVDTLCDEKFESLAAAEAIGEKLAGVRLDTPGSRRGNMAKILDEVRWELDLRGFEHVKLYVSGGLDEATYSSSILTATATASAPRSRTREPSTSRWT